MKALCGCANVLSKLLQLWQIALSGAAPTMSPDFLDPALTGICTAQEASPTGTEGR